MCVLLAQISFYSHTLVERPEGFSEIASIACSTTRRWGLWCKTRPAGRVEQVQQRPRSHTAIIPLALSRFVYCLWFDALSLLSVAPEPQSCTPQVLLSMNPLVNVECRRIAQIYFCTLERSTNHVESELFVSTVRSEVQQDFKSPDSCINVNEKFLN